MRSQQLLLYLITTLIVGTTSAKKMPRLHFEITEMKCTTPNAGIRLYTCSYHRQSEDTYSLNMNIVPNKDFYKKLELRFRLDILQKFAKLPMRLVDLRFDACEVMKVLNKNSILRFIVVEMQRTGNLTSRCPYKAGVLYQYNNMIFSSASFPAYTPDGNITYTMDVLENGVVIATQLLRAAIKSMHYKRSDQKQKSARARK